MNMRADDLIDEIYHGTVGLPREERLVAALRVLHGAALESPYPSSGAWTSLLAELIAVAREGEQAPVCAEAEHVLDYTIRGVVEELDGRCSALPYVKDEEGIAFLVAVDEDADRLTRYIKRYWRRT